MLAFEPSTRISVRLLTEDPDGGTRELGTAA